MIKYKRFFLLLKNWCSMHKMTSLTGRTFIKFGDRLINIRNITQIYKNESCYKNRLVIELNMIKLIGTEIYHNSKPESVTQEYKSQDERDKKFDYIKKSLLFHTISLD